ncbi:hypothetical protein FB45DRAFT_893362 [Roridomyces roridus]|uniref:RPA43 OB domain-containing protein n=1 Tax=Roridomyces roridus TaxID=1738132 RepID=A0AAD7CFQ7_9AGAR|nr:hypothetical protein FB45DRAFT_893362 [Roridomyces roridus]
MLVIRRTFCGLAAGFEESFAKDASRRNEDLHDGPGRCLQIRKGQEWVSKGMFTRTMEGKPKNSPRCQPPPTQKGQARQGKDGEFQVVTASLVLSVPPLFASEPEKGVHELLDSMMMRYMPALRGVFLAHSNITFLKPTASINAECPFLVCHVQFDAAVWCPRVRMKLVGKISLCSPDHVSLLIHRTFNVSIPRHHIPTDEWQFEQDPPADEPEDDDDQDKVGGRWVHKITGKSLGGANGYLEFVVIG